MSTDMYAHDTEPTPEDLAAIEREMPLIEAEIALVDAEIRILAAEQGPSPLDWRRLRRAQQRVLRETVAFLASENADTVASLAESPLSIAA